jgi:hypothetical protein
VRFVRPADGFTRKICRLTTQIDKPTVKFAECIEQINKCIATIAKRVEEFARTTAVRNKGCQNFNKEQLFTEILSSKMTKFSLVN